MRRRARVGEISDDVLIIGGIAAVAYFVIIKPLMNGTSSLFGGNDDMLTAELALSPASNPFSYQYQPFIDFYNNNTPTIPAGQLSSGFSIMNLFGPTVTTSDNNNPSMADFFAYLKQNPGAASPWGMIDTADLSARAEHLKSAIDVSPINPVATSDQTAATSALAGLTRQLQIAFIANYFWYNWGIDLLSYLHGSLLSPGLTQANLDNLITNVNAMSV